MVRTATTRLGASCWRASVLRRWHQWRVFFVSRSYTSMTSIHSSTAHSSSLPSDTTPTYKSSLNTDCSTWMLSVWGVSPLLTCRLFLKKLADWMTHYILPSCKTNFPLPCVRQYMSIREDCQNCSVLYCVTQLCIVSSTLIWAVLTGELF